MDFDRWRINLGGLATSSAIEHRDGYATPESRTLKTGDSGSENAVV